MKKKRYPVYPEIFRARVDRLLDNAKRTGLAFHIPPITVSEFREVLSAYYGSYWRTAFAMLGYAITDAKRKWESRIIMGICDRVGWTKIYAIPQTKDFMAHHQRHGCKCSGSPNCDNMNCIPDSVPKWFRRLTWWHWTIWK